MGRCNPLINRFPESRSGPKSDKVGEHPCFTPSKFKQVNEHAIKVAGWRTLQRGGVLGLPSRDPASFNNNDVAKTLQESLKFNVFAE